MLSRLGTLVGWRSNPSKDDVMRSIEQVASAIDTMLTLQLAWTNLDDKATNWGAHRPAVLAYILGACAGAQAISRLGDETRMPMYLHVALPRLTVPPLKESDIEAVHNEIYYLTLGPNVPDAIASAFSAGEQDFAEAGQGRSPRRLAEIVGLR